MMQATLQKCISDFYGSSGLEQKQPFVGNIQRKRWKGEQNDVHGKLDNN